DGRIKQGHLSVRRRDCPCKHPPTTPYSGITRDEPCAVPPGWRSRTHRPTSAHRGGDRATDLRVRRASWIHDPPHHLSLPRRRRGRRPPTPRRRSPSVPPAWVTARPC